MQPGTHFPQPHGQTSVHDPYNSTLGNYEMKNNNCGEIWTVPTPQPNTSTYPHNPSSFYPYDSFQNHYPYDSRYCPMDMNDGVRRKNATRESTNTLKAWLQDHKKNPYPTKGEKIMLAIITKMTLTQVSTWFANARRRLKKENKMTWIPKNRTSADSSSGSNNNTDGKVTDGEIDEELVSSSAKDGSDVEEVETDQRSTSECSPSTTATISQASYKPASYMDTYYRSAPIPSYAPNIYNRDAWTPSSDKQPISGYYNNDQSSFAYLIENKNDEKPFHPPIVPNMTSSTPSAGMTSSEWPGISSDFYGSSYGPKHPEMLSKVPMTSYPLEADRSVYSHLPVEGPQPDYYPPYNSTSSNYQPMTSQYYEKPTSSVYGASSMIVEDTKMTDLNYFNEPTYFNHQATFSDVTNSVVTSEASTTSGNLLQMSSPGRRLVPTSSSFNLRETANQQKQQQQQQPETITQQVEEGRVSTVINIEAPTTKSIR